MLTAVPEIIRDTAHVELVTLEILMELHVSEVRALIGLL
jgi:hypothetical protein